jgi:hypothetical protein
VANSARVHPNEESIEEIFGQLWVIPNMERARVPEQRSQGGGLVWVCSELVRAGKVTPVDCFLVSQRVEGIPKLISFAPGSWEGGSHPTYVEVLKMFPMAEGGTWVW